MTTGQRLEQERKRSKLTLEKISEIIGISYQAYRKIEKDLNMPSAETLIATSSSSRLKF